MCRVKFFFLQKSVLVIFVGCKSIADLFFDGTALLGCQSFLGAQKQACECPKPNNQKKAKNKKQKYRNEL